VVAVLSWGVYSDTMTPHDTTNAVHNGNQADIVTGYTKISWLPRTLCK